MPAPAVLSFTSESDNSLAEAIVATTTTLMTASAPVPEVARSTPLRVKAASLSPVSASSRTIFNRSPSSRKSPAVTAVTLSTAGSTASLRAAPTKPSVCSTRSSVTVRTVPTGCGSSERLIAAAFLASAAGVQPLVEAWVSPKFTPMGSTSFWSISPSPVASAKLS